MKKIYTWINQYKQLFESCKTTFYNKIVLAFQVASKSIWLPDANKVDSIAVPMYVKM